MVNEEPYKEIKVVKNLFFEPMKQQEQYCINQRNYELEKAQGAQQHTSNLSPHDKSKYYLEHRI